MRIGIDLGGTKIELIALNDQGETLHRQRVATPQGDYSGTIQSISELVNQTEQVLGEQGSVGIGIPGSISPATGLVKNANSVCLIGNPLDNDISEALNRPVRIENDANCFALSEAVDGAAAGESMVFGVIVGTGTGGGLVVDGKALNGPNSITGEWGHNPLPWMMEDEQIDTNCYCGKQGCIETFLSGPGMKRDHLWNTQQELSSEDIVSRAKQGDELCLATLDRYYERMAKGLASVINIFDPHVIVLGGGMSNIDSLYEEVPKRWGNYVFSDEVFTKLVKNQHGDSSGVRGAAWLWPINS